MKQRRARELSRPDLILCRRSSNREASRVDARETSDGFFARRRDVCGVGVSHFTRPSRRFAYSECSCCCGSSSRLGERFVFECHARGHATPDAMTRYRSAPSLGFDALRCKLEDRCREEIRTKYWRSLATRSNIEALVACAVPASHRERMPPGKPCAVRHLVANFRVVAACSGDRLSRRFCDHDNIYRATRSHRGQSHAR
jgi:hypothetical protein